MTPGDPNIFEYLDYRLFLRDLFAARMDDAQFTHRAILQRMGISSTGFLSNILSGKRNLPLEHIPSLCRAIRLSRGAAARFEHMVQYTQSKTIEEKKRHFDRIMKINKVALKILGRDQMGLFSRWYFVYIRELIHFFPVSDNYKEVANTMMPPVSPFQVQQALEELMNMGLICRGADGCFRQTDKVVSSGDEVASLHLAHFQKTTMDFSKDALENVPADERDISFCAMSLSEEGFAEIKREIQGFRKKILAIAQRDENSNRVYQCNIQLFPVTKKPGKKDQTAGEKA